MINSTFGGFMTARLGMNVSQQALNIVGQNISNVGTTGYTRQRLDQVSLNIGGSGNRYSSLYSVNIGNGALATGVSQIRDPFLDRRYRNEMAQVGQYDIRTSGLQGFRYSDSCSLLPGSDTFSRRLHTQALPVSSWI